MIEFQSVSKTFRDGTTAVDDLSLIVPSDKITVLVGPSGCGKTTSLRMINRMIEPSKGKILWDGAPLKGKRRTALRRQMGYVIQSGGLFPHRTVLENIGTVPGLLNWDKAKARKRSFELLESVGLARKFAHRYPAQLSGGQQQRVGVARALAADPLVLLMDEPFSAVDPVVRSELHELFLDLQQRLSKTIILITHDIDEAIKLGDQVAVLRVGGRLAQVGTPQQLLDEPVDDFVEGFVGRDRGYRALSFLPASGLVLNRVQAVRDPASAYGSEPVIVVDADANPQGWADLNRPGQVLPLGSIFDPESDTLRVALDSALTSPVGLAVAVSGGRYAGVVSASEILGQVTATRAAVADAASVRLPYATSAALSAEDVDATQIRTEETHPDPFARPLPEPAEETELVEEPPLPELVEGPESVEGAETGGEVPDESLTETVIADPSTGSGNEAEAAEDLGAGDAEQAATPESEEIDLPDAPAPDVEEGTDAPEADSADNAAEVGSTDDWAAAVDVPDAEESAAAGGSESDADQVDAETRSEP